MGAERVGTHPILCYENSNPSYNKLQDIQKTKKKIITQDLNIFSSSFCHMLSDKFVNYFFIILLLKYL